MKTLVVYYSKTGNTGIVAKELAQTLSAEIEQIVETQPKEGIVGMILAGKDAALQNSTPITELKNKVADYDLVVIGTPIWAWTMANPIRAFIEKNKKDLKKIAFFATMGNSGDKRAFSHMEKLSGLTPAATISFVDSKVKNGEFKTGLAEFSKKLTA